MSSVREICQKHVGINRAYSSDPTEVSVVPQSDLQGLSNRSSKPHTRHITCRQKGFCVGSTQDSESALMTAERNQTSRNKNLDDGPN